MQSSVLYNIHCNIIRYLVARLEAPLIALALFLVQVNLLGEMALERYLISWLGVVILMWTARSIVKVDEVHGLYVKISGIVKYPAFLAAQSRAGSLFIDFLIDFMIVGTALFMFRGGADVTVMALSGALVIVTQAVVNFSIFIGHIYLSRWINIKNAMFVMFLFFVIMSPVFFMFDDLKHYGNQYFTSFNPAAHFLAAYYNVFWFREPMSLQVLPVILVILGACVLMYSFWIEPKTRRLAAPESQAETGTKALALDRYMERGSTTGLEMLFSFYAFGSHPMAELAHRVRRLAEIQDLKDQLRRSLSTYSRQNDLYLDLVLASCLANDQETLLSLPDEEIMHVSEARVVDVLSQINAIMGTKLCINGVRFQPSGI